MEEVAPRSVWADAKALRDALLRWDAMQQSTLPYVHNATHDARQMPVTPLAPGLSSLALRAGQLRDAERMLSQLHASLEVFERLVDTMRALAAAGGPPSPANPASARSAGVVSEWSADCARMHARELLHKRMLLARGKLDGWADEPYINAALTRYIMAQTGGEE